MPIRHLTPILRAVAIVRSTVGHVATKSGSWRTTIVGLAFGLPVLLSEVARALDPANPDAVADTRVAVLAVAVIVIGFLARDNVVPSESARIAPSSTPPEESAP
jgi:hypothetical protein